jgi:hypothetical protein
MTLCELHNLDQKTQTEMFEKFCDRYDLDINDKTSLIVFQVAFHPGDDDTQVVAQKQQQIF